MVFKIFLVGGFHAIFGLCTGYFSSALNPLEPWVKDLINSSIASHYHHHLNEGQLAWLWAGAVAAYTCGALVSALILQYLVHWIGKRDAVMVVRNLILISASLLLFGCKPANSIELLYLGRFLAGYAQCMSGMISVLLVESLPLAYAGIVSALVKTSNRAWNMLGVIVGLTQTGATELNWNYRMLIPLVMASVHLTGLLFIPRSPKFLYIMRRNEAEAKNAVKFYHGDHVPWEPIRSQYEAEKNMNQGLKPPTFLKMMKVSYMRWPVFICVTAAAANIFAGCDLVVQYAVGIMVNLGLDMDKYGLYAVLVLYVPGLVCGVLCSIFINQIGRRKLLLGTLGTSIIGLFVLCGAGYVTNRISSSVLAVGSLLVIWLSVNGGVGVLHQILAGELSIQACSARTASLAFFSDWAFTTIFLLFYPSFQQWFHELSVLPYAICAILAWAFLYKFLPETTNRTVHEIISENWPERRKSENFETSQGEMALERF